MRVLIAGCGYVGCAFGALLASEGHTVFGLRRNPAYLPENIRPVVADLSRPIASETLPRELDFVFYTASAGGSEDAAYRSAYVDGPRNLLGALSSRWRSIRRLFFMSSTGVCAQSRGEWVDETSPTEPDSHTGRRLLEGERVVSEGPFPATVVRLAGIYGPGRTRSVERALEVPVDDGPPVYANRIHRDDCAGVLRHLMLLPGPAPLYLATDCEPADQRTVAEWLSARLDRPLPEAYPADARRTNRRTNKRCSNDRLVASGYEFRYPTFREGFAGLVNEV